MSNAPNSGRPRLSMSESPSLAFHVIKFGLWALCLSVAGVVTIFVSRELGFISKGEPRKDGPPQAAARGENAGRADEPQAEEVPQETTKAGELRARLTLAKAKQQAAVTLANEALRTLDEWTKESQAFEKATATLQTSDEGKSIAANPEHLSRMRAILEHPRPRSGNAVDLRTAAELLKGSVSASLADQADASIPPDDFTSQLQSILAQAVQGRDAFKLANAQVDAVMKAAGGTAGEVTLDEAIAELRRKEADEHTATVAAAQKKVREDYTQKLAKQKANEEEQRGKQELQEREARLKAETAEREARMKEERLWRIARSQRARELLQPVAAINPKSKTAITWQIPLLGQPFGGSKSFRYNFIYSLLLAEEPTNVRMMPYINGNDDQRGRLIYEQRDADCQKEFGMSLYELFREVCLRDQENAFLNQDEVRNFIASTPEGGFLYNKLIGRSNTPPPKPLPKPDWLRD